jgi:hypothetical protein
MRENALNDHFEADLKADEPGRYEGATAVKAVPSPISALDQKS